MLYSRMRATSPRQRVYVEFHHGKASMRRVLDLAFVDFTQVVAVITWIKVDGEMQLGDYVELDERRLRRSTPAGMFAYDGVIEDPRFPSSAKG
jgi:hypothetical protein